MFEYGLEYIRVDFHLHTNKDKEFIYDGEKNDFVKSYVNALKQSGIGIGVITNHNKFDKDEYVAIRKAAKKEDIFILPGIELTVKEGANGIHTLIIFNPDEWIENGTNHIQSFLAGAFANVSNPENRNTKCKYDLRRTLEELESYGRDYIVIFAHVDQSSGLFSECKGGLLESLANIISFKKRVLGLQKSRTRDNVDKFKQYFGYMPALIEGSDPKNINDIGKGDKTSYLKMGEYSYYAVKFALQDYNNRISENIPSIKHGYIESISFQGGKFDGQNIVFSPGLNALIGIRGSGKSSVLEAIRYLFNISAEADKAYKESLVKNIFGSGGKAIMSVVDQYGKKYTINRILGERIHILDENDEDLNITPLRLFEGVQYFGQKDLSNSTDHENGLLEKIVRGKISSQTTVDESVEKLCTAIGQLLDVSKIPNLIEESKMQQTEIEHKLSIYKEKGVAEKLKKQAAYVSDSAKLETIKNKIDKLYKDFFAVYEKNSSISNLLSQVHNPV